jgi:uncharacterized protein (TIGR00725 family)
MRVSVIGGSTADAATRDQAHDVGRLLADRGHRVVCGGRGGVMRAVCRGADEAGGEPIGVLPGDGDGANDFVGTPIATGMGGARNPLVVLNGDAVIAVDGGAGTLSELGHALDLGRPVAGLDTHRVDGVAGIEHVDTPRAAVEYVERAVD